MCAICLRFVAVLHSEFFCAWLLRVCAKRVRSVLHPKLTCMCVCVYSGRISRILSRSSLPAGCTRAWARVCGAVPSQKRVCGCCYALGWYAPLAVPLSRSLSFFRPSSVSALTPRFGLVPPAKDAFLFCLALSSFCLSLSLPLSLLLFRFEAAY